MKNLVLILGILVLAVSACEKTIPSPNPKNQGNPALGTDNFDNESSSVPTTSCTQYYTIYNNDQYNYTLYWPGGGTSYIPAYSSIYYTLTYAGCATVAFYDGSYDEGDLSFCPCSDSPNYTIDKY